MPLPDSGVKETRSPWTSHVVRDCWLRGPLQPPSYPSRTASMMLHSADNTQSNGTGCDTDEESLTKMHTARTQTARAMFVAATRACEA